ncbi:MAG: universal stress protein [Deltaproteobacteria bacterium]|nr:universal stress protein [Deltaproteobacteria bacterium]
MNIEKVLFVTKFEDLWFDALESLMDLRKASMNHVVFLNVIQRDKVAMRRGKGYEKKEEIRLREMANIRFINWAENLFEQGIEVGAYIVVGGLVQKVIMAIENEGIDLVVIGNLKKGRFEQFYAPSDIIEIIRRSDTPVLVYKYKASPEAGAEKPFERPLLATSFSQTSNQAVEYLKKLGKVVEKVNVINVAEPKLLKEPSAMAIQRTRKESRKKLEEICDVLISHGIDAAPSVYVGSPVQEIENAAREFNATMIIAGTSSKDSWRERFVGSTPRKLAENSAFPTLLVPPGK